MHSVFARAFSWYSRHIKQLSYALCGLSLIVVFIERCLVVFSYAGHTAGIDNNFDFAVIRALGGYSIYPNPQDFPFVINPYAPFFFIAAKCCAALLQINAEDTIAVYRVTRGLSLVFDIATCLLLFRLLRNYLQAKSIIAMAVTALFFCTISYLGYTINRSDSLFLLFYCSVIYSLFKYNDSQKLVLPLVAALLVACCIFSKQNGIGLLAIVPIWLLVGRQYRQLALFLLFAAMFISLFAWYFQYQYSNGFFFDHVYRSLKNRIDPQYFYIYVFKLIVPGYLTLPLAAALVTAFGVLGGNGGTLLKKTAAIFIFQLLFSIGLSLKWGSSLGYFNESFLLSAILLPAFCLSPSSGISSKSLSPVFVFSFPALALLLLHMIAQLYFFFVNSQPELKSAFREQVAVSRYISDRIGIQDKYAVDLSDPDFNFFKNLLYSKMAAPNMDAVSCCTLPDHIFDYSALLKGLETGKIAFLIEARGTAKDSVWGIDLGHYHLVRSFDNYSVYEYRAESNRP